MSHKIKILDNSQYSDLLSGETGDRHSNIQIYLASILPGLFYSVKDLIVDRSNMRYLYIPPEELGQRYSPGVFDRIAFKKLSLHTQDIPVDDKVFVPIMVEDIIIGGFYGEYEDFKDVRDNSLIEKLNISDYFGMIFNASPAIDAGELSIQLLDRVARSKSMDSFLRSLPDWIIEQIGGGQVGFYYKIGKEYHQRCIIGVLGDFEDMPRVIAEGDAMVIGQAVSEGCAFIPLGVIPAKASEIQYPPKVRFAVGGSFDDSLKFIMTGIIPGITDYLPALFVERLADTVSGLSVRHFGRDVEWSRILAACDELLNSGKTYDSLAELLLKELNEYININRISIAKYINLENRISIKGTAAINGKRPLDNGCTFTIRGSEFERVLETGKYDSGDFNPSGLKNKLHINLYKEGVRSYITIPIRAEGTIYGFISIGSPLTGDYLRRYINIFEALAHYLGGIEQARDFGNQLRVLSDQINQLEQKLSVVENMRTLGELAGGVFHDLNNALGAILGRCQLIQTKAAKIENEEIAEKIARDAALIEKSTVDSGDILDRLRQLAKPGRRKKRQTVDINSLVNDSIEMIRPRWQNLVRENGVKYTLEKNLKLDASVFVDSSEIREVFTNILLNALDAMPSGGTISVANKITDSAVTVYIADSGTGMSAEVVKQVFEPFYTTKGDSGTGLGLSLSKKIIEDHGGTITVKSEEGKGTTFIVTLPISKMKYSSNGDPAHELISRGDISILLVEDRHDLKETIAELLEARGFKIRTASSGEQAIQMCGKSRYDVIITDFGLPGISGLDLARHIKDVDSRMKLILISGWEIEESIAELMKKGVDSLITKPFQAEVILETIVTLLDAKSPSISRK